MSLKRLVPHVGHVNTRARQTFMDVPKLEAMLEKSGLADFYRKSNNLTIVDAYAGYGWFSTALYNTLRPKKLFMLDQNGYAQEPLGKLQAQDPEVVKLISQNPFQWKAYFPVYESIDKKYNNASRHRVSRDFLFVANLAYIRGAPLLYQFLLCILHQNWLQRYGRVRMLIWMPAEAAEKLTHGTHVAAKAPNVDVHVERIAKYKLKIKDCEEGIKILGHRPSSYNSRVRKIAKYKEDIKRFEARRDEVLAKAAAHTGNKRYKSTIIREMTCDYRYLIGGNVEWTKRNKPATSEKQRQLQIKRKLDGTHKNTPQMTCNPRDKKAVVYYEDGYQDFFGPKKHATSIGSIVLLELTPKNFKLDRIEEFFFVLTRLFVSTNEPIGQTLETLGPGATEWMSPHLTPKILNSRINEIGIADLEHLVEVFWQWPFKPQVLMDTYEERSVSTPDVSSFDTTMFDFEDEDGEGEGGVDDDDMM